MNNIIDIKKVPVTELKNGNTYIGISQDGEVIRTTIEIPEGGGSTGEGADWSVSDGDGVIKNRTHYANFINKLSFHKDNGRWISDEIEDTNALYLLPQLGADSEYVMVTEDKIINNAILLETEGANGTYRIIGSYPYYIEFSGNPSLGEKLESGIKYTWPFPSFIKPLNDVFIPDSVARKKDYYTKSEVDGLIENIDIPEGGGSSSSDSGVYVLESVDDITENNDEEWFENPYEGSDRQTHNAAVYQAWKEGKVKALYYKNARYYDDEGGNKVSFQLVPCAVSRGFSWNIGNEAFMHITALYKFTVDSPIDIHSISIAMKEDGSVIKDYYYSEVSLEVPSMGECQARDWGDGYGMLKDFAWEFYSGRWKLCFAMLESENGNQRVLLNYDAKNIFDEGGTLTIYGTLSNGDIIKWDFPTYYGEITEDWVFSQIVSIKE